MTTTTSRLEALTDRMLGSRGARYAGLVVGVGAVAFLVRSLARAGDDALGWFATVTPLELAAAALGFAVFHVGSVATLRPIFRGPSLRIWGAAQLVKYLPVPGSAVIGIVGSTVRSGGTTRHGVAVTVRHSLLQVGTATVVGVAAVAPAAQDWIGMPILATSIVGVAAGLGTAWLAVRHLPAATVLWTIVLSTLTWAALGVLLWIGVAQGMGDGVGDAVRLSATFAAAWVVGQLALPVPAGIGIREFALVLLLGPLIGEVGALSFALGTRLMHIGSDAVLSGVMLARGGWNSIRAGLRRSDQQP